MGVANVPLRSPAWLTYAVVIGCLLGPRCAMAFPASDPSNPSVESDIPPPTDADLRHQLQLQSGFGAGAAGAGGWTFVPRVSLQEMYTDNVLQTSTNRRWDLVTLFTPGFSLLGDVPNAQVKLDYGPQLREDLRTPQEDGVTQQLLGLSFYKNGLPAGTSLTFAMPFDSTIVGGNPAKTIPTLTAYDPSSITSSDPSKWSALSSVQIKFDGVVPNPNGGTTAVTATPEPSTFAPGLLGLGVAGVVWTRRRRRL